MGHIWFPQSKARGNPHTFEITVVESWSGHTTHFLTLI